VIRKYLDKIAESTAESQEYLHTVVRRLQQLQSEGLFERIHAFEQALDSVVFPSQEILAMVDEVTAVRKLQQLQSEGLFEQIRAFEQALDSVVFPSQEIFAVLDRVQDAYATLLRQVKLPDFEAWARAEREATKILTARGWWPHPEWPVAVLHRVVRLKREGRIRQLDREICESYEANRARPMRRAIGRWMSLPEFGARRGILEDGLWAYRRRKYGLAITQWLPHIEGILRSYAERQGLAQSAWKRLGRDIRGEQPDYMRSFTDAFFDAWASLYNEALPTGRRAPQTSRFPIQRDSILHGVDLRFGRRAHAMRIFLMLDTLHFFLISFERTEMSAA